MDKAEIRRTMGYEAAANPKNPIGKEGIPGRRHREIVQAIQENRDQSRAASQGLSSALGTLSDRLRSIRNTQQWMFATLILCLILSGLTAVLMGLLILRLNG